MFIMCRQLEYNNTTDVIIGNLIKSWLNSGQLCQVKTEEGDYIWHDAQSNLSDIKCLTHCFSKILKCFNSMPKRVIN